MSRGRPRGHTPLQRRTRGRWRFSRRCEKSEIRSRVSRCRFSSASLVHPHILSAIFLLHPTQTDSLLARPGLTLSPRFQAKAKIALSYAQRPIALTYLRSKHALEDLLLKRVSAGEQLRGVIRSIDQAKGDVEVSKMSPLSSPSLYMFYLFFSASRPSVSTYKAQCLLTSANRS